MGYISCVVQYVIHVQCCTSLSLSYAWQLLSEFFNVLAWFSPVEGRLLEVFSVLFVGFWLFAVLYFLSPYIHYSKSLYKSLMCSVNPPPVQVNGLEVTTWPKLGNKVFHTRNLKLELLETNQVVLGAQVTILRWLWWKMRWEWWSSERRRLN